MLWKIEGEYGAAVRGVGVFPLPFPHATSRNLSNKNSVAVTYGRSRTSRLTGSTKRMDTAWYCSLLHGGVYLHNPPVHGYGRRDDQARCALFIPYRYAIE